MSNKCPNCGAEMSMGQNIDKNVMKFQYRCHTVMYDVNGKILYHESDRCRGRAEAIAELDAWHTGEPPADAEYPCRFCEHEGRNPNISFGGYASRGKFWVECENCGTVGPRANSRESAWRGWNILNKHWRKVRP